VEPEFFAAMVNDRSASVDPVDADIYDEEDEEVDLDGFDDEAPVQRRGAGARVQNFRSDAATRVAAPAARPVPGSRVQREAQTSLIGSDSFEMP
ncbi:cell division protein FtsK, partial [Mesorhizobium sp. M4B.F.Ca.ET.215.01.1.1]